jgi:hypothetical protein
MGSQGLDGYSAQVAIYLLVHGEQLRISKIGPTAFFLRDRLAIPPATHAQILFRIDGHEEIQNIFLSEGATGTAEPVTYRIDASPAVASW